MMPSAKMVIRRNIPPLNRSNIPKTVPVDAGDRNESADAIDGEQRQGEEQPLAQVGNPKDVGERFKKLHDFLLRTTLALPGAPNCALYSAILLLCPDHFLRSAGLLNFCKRRL